MYRQEKNDDISKNRRRAMLRNRLIRLDKWGGFSEGKIKGGGVTPRLTPCLHIGFYAPNAKRLGGMDFTRSPVKPRAFGGVTLYFTNTLSRKVGHG
jgi:hypothetical protein